MQKWTGKQALRSLCNYTCQALWGSSFLHCAVHESAVWGVISLEMVKGFWTPSNSAHPDTHTQRKSKSNSQWSTGVSGNTCPSDITWHHRDHVLSTEKACLVLLLSFLLQATKYFKCLMLNSRLLYVCLYRQILSIQFLTIIKTQCSNYKKT